MRLPFSPEEERIIRKLSTPRKIQDFLETLPANFEESGETCMSPRRVLEVRKAHCMEGAMFAAAVLWYHGQEPLLLDLKTVPGDYDHVVALFKQHGYWGAISKTNHAVLRYREPIHKTIRELALSYFHEYFLDNGKKTLRSYSRRPFNLRQFKLEWLTASEDLWYIPQALDAAPHDAILNAQMIRLLRKADPIEREAGKLTVFRKK